MNYEFVPHPKHSRFIDLTGQVFGRLTVLGYAGNQEWLCKCSCGAVKPVGRGDLRSGHSQSCGCLRTELQPTRSKTHGLRYVPEYQIWNAIITRCYRQNSKSYPIYGGRGIKMCDEWRHSFANFYRDMGPRPTPNHTIERESSNGDYCPENCCWATRHEQSRNTSQTHLITFGGTTMCLKDWAESIGITAGSLKDRINRHGVEWALTTPKLGNNRKLITAVESAST